MEGIEGVEGEMEGVEGVEGMEGEMEGVEGEEGEGKIELPI